MPISFFHLFFNFIDNIANINAFRPVDFMFYVYVKNISKKEQKNKKIQIGKKEREKFSYHKRNELDIKFLMHT